MLQDRAKGFYTGWIFAGVFLGGNWRMGCGRGSRRHISRFVADRWKLIMGGHHAVTPHQQSQQKLPGQMRDDPDLRTDTYGRMRKDGNIWFAVVLKGIDVKTQVNPNT